MSRKSIILMAVMIISGVLIGIFTDELTSFIEITPTVALVGLGIIIPIMIIATVTYDDNSESNVLGKFSLQLNILGYLVIGLCVGVILFIILFMLGFDPSVAIDESFWNFRSENLNLRVSEIEVVSSLFSLMIVFLVAIYINNIWAVSLFLGIQFAIGTIVIVFHNHMIGYTYGGHLIFVVIFGSLIFLLSKQFDQLKQRLQNKQV